MVSNLKKSFFIISILFIISLSARADYISENFEIPQEFAEQFNSLTAQEQTQFFEKRTAILQKMEFGLRKSRWVFYVSSLMKSGLIKIKNVILYDSLADQPSDEIKEMMRIDQLNNPEKFIEKKLSIRTDEKIKSLLRATDLKLWSQSLLVANANQFSFLFATELIAEGGTTAKKWGGLYDLGFTLGYNTESKAVVFQIFRNREKFESSLMPALAVGGLVVKIGPLISRSTENTTLHTTGESFYPPFVPGFQSTTKESFAFGFSSGLTWPPSPFGDMLTYTNSMDQKVLLKISFSKTFLGFVRVKTNLTSDSLKFVQEKFTNLFKPQLKARACEGLF